MAATNLPHIVRLGVNRVDVYMTLSDELGVTDFV